MESPALHIRLLGALDLRYGESPLPSLGSARAESLLAYLLLHRDAPQPRQHLSFLLWPDSTEPQARTNLRHVLHNLRRALPDADRFLDVQPRTLQWRTDAPYWLDVAAFEAALSGTEGEAGDSWNGLREAVGLYTDDLLPTCYDEWLLSERERLRQLYLAALERLVGHLAAGGEHGQAIRYAERLLRHDPLHEETYRLLMRLHDACGERARALRTYHVCATTLQRELDVEPSPRTREIYEALLPAEWEPVAAMPQARRRDHLPLVGRAAEWMHLTALWRATERGRSQLVLVSGEAGVGKTRLVEALRAWCASRGATTAEACSYAAEGALAYGPIVTWLRSGDLSARSARLDPVHRSELARLLPELGNGTIAPVSPEPLSESEQRQRLFDALARALLALGAPLLLVIDDLQWSDRESLQFLHYLLRYRPDAPLLVAATARREELDDRHALHDLVAGLQMLERFTELPLERLTREETALLARQLAGDGFEEPELDELYHETEGNPLFLIESLRAGWQPGRPVRGRISARVQAVIHSRLAQLSPTARELIDVAATIGRAFSSELLKEASGVDEERLVHGLDELWRRHIIREQGATAYDFSHDKIREVAYLALSPALRRHHHLRVAQALARLHADDPGPVSAQLATHHEHAGRGDLAIAWYERAADVAQRVHASAEATHLLERALDHLHALPESRERQERELTILTTLLVPLVELEGYRSSRLTEVQQRALALTHLLTVEPEPPLLRSLALASLSQGDFERAQRLGEQLRARGERESDDILLVEGEYVLGIAAYWQGQFTVAREHFEVSIAHYRNEHRPDHLFRYGQDPKVVCLGRLGLTLWFLGRAGSAVEARAAAVALAEEIGHPMTVAVALLFAAVLSVELREPERLREYVARIATVRAVRSISVQIPVDALAGYIDVLDGHVAAGIARIRRAVQDARGAQSAPGLEAVLVRLLLAACEVAGNARAGLAAADRALAFPGGARVWEAEAHRLRGQFLGALGGAREEVEAELDQALRIARSQGAQALVLRVTMTLLRHRLACGAPGTNEAYERLRAAVEALPERHETPDLHEATLLLTPG